MINRGTIVIMLELLDTYSIFFYVILALLGLCIGSFLNVVIIRLPKIMERSWYQQCVDYLKLPAEQYRPQTQRYNLAFPRSFCPNCKRNLKWWHNIPLLSYLFLGGKCAYCNHKISIQYPLIECVTSVLLVLLALKFGFTIKFLLVALLVCGLIVSFMIDLKHQLLPDDITLPLLWLGLLANVFAIFASLPSAVLGAAIGYSVLWLIAKSYKFVTKQEGMGHGDFKLTALFGAWAGWEVLPYVILMSALLGTVVGMLWLWLNKKDRKTPIPFGPFIIIAGMTMLLWGNVIESAYLNWILR